MGFRFALSLASLLAAACSHAPRGSVATPAAPPVHVAVPERAARNGSERSEFGRGGNTERPAEPREASVHVDFAAYPNRRVVCAQHISGFSGAKTVHIAWRLEASIDASEQVAAFYRARHPDWVRVDPIAPGEHSDLVTLRPNEHDLLRVRRFEHERPTCDGNFLQGERTAIVVSRLID